MSITFISQDPISCDTLAEMNTLLTLYSNLPDMTQCYVKDDNDFYQLQNGVWVQIFPDPEVMMWLQTNSTDIANLKTGKLDKTAVGAANGVAPLDAGAKIPSAYLPSYVDDVLEYANLAALPVTGESGKIYITIDTNFEYRWSGSTYVRLVSSPGTSDALLEGVVNLYHTAARVLSTVLTGFSTASAAAVVATDTILQAIGKLQAQINAIVGVTQIFGTPVFASVTNPAILSPTRNALVSYSFDQDLAVTVLGGQGMVATLRYADNAGMSANVVVVQRQIVKTSGLAGLANTQTLTVGGKIPANKYRQVTFTPTQTGTATAPAAPTALAAGQEVIE